MTLLPQAVVEALKQHPRYMSDRLTSGLSEGVWRRPTALRIGPEVPERRARVGLAVRLSVGSAIAGPA